MSGEPRFRGYLDKLTTNCVSGWVVRADLTEPFEVEVVVNGEVRAVGRTEHVRPDLLSAGITSDGRGGYLVPVELAPGDIVEVRPKGFEPKRNGAMRIVPPADPLPTFGIAAIIRNECPYITEWIAHHRLMGFHHFFIADNESDDGTWELLQALESLGYLKCFRFPNPPGQAPQLPAYVELMRRFGSEVDWMAFIDADEFVWPTNGERMAVPSLAGLGIRPEIGAIVLNWALYGSSGHKNHAAGLVTERFERRAPLRFKVNHHYKTVLRTAAWTGAFSNPHEPPLEDRWWVVHVNGAPVIHHPKYGKGVSNQVIWDVMRLNHYAVRSRQEFDERKGPKGSSSSLTRVKGDKYFAHHDRNEAVDPMPKRALSRLVEEVARIETALASAGHELPARSAAAVVYAEPLQGSPPERL